MSDLRLAVSQSGPQVTKLVELPCELAPEGHAAMTQAALTSLGMLLLCRPDSVNAVLYTTLSMHSFIYQHHLTTCSRTQLTRSMT